MSPSSPRWGHAVSCRSARACVRFDPQFVLSGLLIAISTWFVSISSAHAQTPAARRIVVRSYNTIGVRQTMLRRAESTVHELLQQAGVEASSRDCRTDRGPSSQSPDTCSERLTTSESVVRIVRTPRAVTDPDGLGYSHVDPYVRQGTVATVFADRIRVLAAALRVDEGTLLGRAMTHEIGHLLLGTLEHSEGGLMRRHWSERGGAADWLFSQAQAEQIRRAVFIRIEGPPKAAVALAQAAELSDKKPQ